MANKVKQDFRQLLRHKIIVADGAMGTMLYSRGIYINQCFEFLNVLRPEMVKQIHREYLMAGAEVIETNTFGANEVKLSGFGLQDRVFEINFQGAQLAKEVAGESAFVAGSIGPLGKPLAPMGIISTDEALGYFKQQVEALLEGGVDIFVLETFSDIVEIKTAIKAIRSLTNKPIIAQMTLMEDKKTIYGISPEEIAKELSGEDIDVLGLNCSVGPAILLECIERMRPHTSLPLSAQPNAGLPKNVDGRLIYLATPEYMAEYARRFIQSGVNMVGACCGSTPEHIKAIKNAVKSIQPVQAVEKSSISVEVEKISKVRAPEVKPSLAEVSSLARKLKEKKFVVSVEIDPPIGVDPSKVLASAKKLREHNIDAINIADGPRASARMSPLALALLINNQVGIEVILHYCCRDRNILGIQSDLLGAYALGIRNLLLITGDPPKLGNYPFATGVFDVDSIGLVRIATNLNEGKDLIGNPLGESTNFFIGVGANPGAIDIDTEIRRFEEKVKNGAQFCLTQPVFDIRVFENFLKRIEEFKIPILAGILPLYSYRNAEFLHNEVPGMQIPEPIRERMRRAESPESARKEGVRIAQEALKELIPMVQGAYFMPPFGKVELALQVLEILEQ